MVCRPSTTMGLELSEAPPESVWSWVTEHSNVASFRLVVAVGTLHAQGTKGIGSHSEGSSGGGGVDLGGETCVLAGVEAAGVNRKK